ncbi:umecyanin-like [Amaranthus tricolor]|uniref:umecyanin-like n=1 Tax=Amaranthus tricolor TaxID=29722 RepID=UPI00258EFDDB|nr:umecyanin-like [Amaranthus tricolor]
MGKFEKYLMILVAITITTLILGNYNVSATEFIVGDDQGWDIPASLTMYSTWASQQKFSVGDVLVFNFLSGVHTVGLVESTAFDTCDTSSTISVISEAPARIPLQEIGQLHFICTVGSHCLSGQKLAINVTDNSSLLFSPAPSPSPSPLSAPMDSSSSIYTPFANFYLLSSLVFVLLF